MPAVPDGVYRDSTRSTMVLHGHARPRCRIKNLRVALYVASPKNLRFEAVIPGPASARGYAFVMELSMSQRQAVTKKKAAAYKRATRADKSRILTSWSSSTAGTGTTPGPL